jgi:hypothetical protein
MIAGPRPRGNSHPSEVYCPCVDPRQSILRGAGTVRSLATGARLGVRCLAKGARHSVRFLSQFARQGSAPSAGLRDRDVHSLHSVHSVHSVNTLAWDVRKVCRPYTRSALVRQHCAC